MAASKLNVERLRREMLIRGWDGIDLAYFSGVSPATVSAAMQGHPVSATTIRKLGTALYEAPVVAGTEMLIG